MSSPSSYDLFTNAPLVLQELTKEKAAALRAAAAEAKALGQQDPTNTFGL